MARRLALLTVGLVLAPAAPAAADPTPSFVVQGGGPVVAGEPATFVSTSTPDPGQLIDEVEWDFEGDGSFVSGNAPTYTYAVHGVHWLRMRVSDSAGPEEEELFPVTVLARPVPAS